MNIKKYYIIISMLVVLTPTVSVLVFAQETITVRDEVITTSHHKVYEYCNTANLQDLGVSYSIENCPINTIIIHNWDRLDNTTQTTIDDRLESIGYQDKGTVTTEERSVMEREVINETKTE